MQVDGFIVHLKMHPTKLIFYRQINGITNLNW